jgi:hypothetical protein
MNTQLFINQFPKEIPPYQLDIHDGSADTFYVLLDLFSARILKEGHEKFDHLIDHYRKFQAGKKEEMTFSDDENILDLLLLGVLWNAHKGKWGRSINIKKAVFNRLYRIRTNNAQLKPLADSVRGKLSPILDNRVDENVEISLVNLQKLTAWLSATGDFNEEVRRIESWIHFLDNQPESLVQILLIHVERFAKWFEKAAFNVLHDYTRGVDLFLTSHVARYKGKEDYFFTGRKEVEYHLNMVGASIMNRSMQQEFLETEHKILLLPSCMAKNEQCKSVEVMHGRICSHCSKNCAISKVSEEMKERGVHTYIIKHSSSFSKYLERWANQKKIGLIGTACTLNLLMGGYEMKRLNISAQCVFLDYPGCKKHWSAEGIPTKICVSQVDHLVRPLKEKEYMAV